MRLNHHHLELLWHRRLTSLQGCHHNLRIFDCPDTADPLLSSSTVNTESHRNIGQKHSSYLLCFREVVTSLRKLLQRTCHWKSLISFRCCQWLHLNYLKFLSKTSFALNSLSPRLPLLLFQIHEREREKRRKYIVQQQKPHWIKQKIPSEGSLQQFEPSYLMKM